MTAPFRLIYLLEFSLTCELRSKNVRSVVGPLRPTMWPRSGSGQSVTTGALPSYSSSDTTAPALETAPLEVDPMTDLRNRIFPMAVVAMLAGILPASPVALGDEHETHRNEKSAAEDRPIIRLDDLLQEALKNRPSLQAAKFDAESKEAEIGPKGAYENPMLGFSFMNYPIDTLSGGEFGMTGNEWSLTQRIPFPGKPSKLSSAAELDAQSKRAEYSNQQLQLIREVKMAYYDLFFANKKRDLLDEQLGVIRQLITVTRSKYTLGRIQQAELLSLQMEEGNILDQILTADKQVSLKTGDLNHAVGRGNHHHVGSPEAPSRPKLDLSKLTEEAIGEKIVAKNPGFHAVQNQRDASDIKLSYARAGYLPDFEFRFAYTQRQPSPGDRGVDFLSAGVALSLPIWALTKESQAVHGARADVARAEAMLEEERIHLLHRVHSSYTELLEAQSRLKLLEGGLIPLAKQSVQSAKSAFLAGKIDYAAVLNTIRGRYQTEVAYFDALTTLESKVAEFESLLGEPLEAQ